MNERGFFGDLVLVIVVLTISAFLLIVSYLILDNTANSFAKLGNAEVDKDFQNSLGALKFMDALIVLLYGGLNIGAMILAWNIKTHPILLGFFIIITPGFVIGAAYISNSYYNIVGGSSQLSTVANNAFPMITTLMLNLPLLTIVMVSLLAIVSYTRFNA